MSALNLSSGTFEDGEIVLTIRLELEHLLPAPGEYGNLDRLQLALVLTNTFFPHRYAEGLVQAIEDWLLDGGMNSQACQMVEQVSVEMLEDMQLS